MRGQHRPVLVLRARPGCDADVAALATMGVAAAALPLTRAIEAAQGADDLPTMIGTMPLLLTSRRAVDALAAFDGRADLAGAAAWCVGPATARAARASGLTVVREGAGSLDDLLAQQPPRPLLWLAGDPRQTLPEAWATRIIVRTVYRMVPAFDAAQESIVAARLAAARLWVVHGAAAGRIAAQLVPDGAARARIAIAAISANVASALGDGWGRIATPARPDRAQLLALGARLCQMEPQPSPHGPPTRHGP